MLFKCVTCMNACVLQFAWCAVSGGHVLSATGHSLSTIVCRWSQVQHLVDDKHLLFHASDVQSKAGKVIKYVTKYGSEVHQTLSDAGLAPTLYELVQLPGGFMQVSLTWTMSLPAI